MLFRSDGYTTEDGEELSVREIKRILKECVDTEDKEKPYTCLLYTSYQYGMLDLKERIAHELRNLDHS